MKTRYCRYCRENVPMFDNQEKATLDEIYRDCVLNAKEYRQTQDIQLKKHPSMNYFNRFSKSMKN